MRSTKFFYEAFTMDIENEFFSSKVTIHTQEIMENLTERMFFKFHRDGIVFEHPGSQAYDYAEKLVEEVEDALEESEVFADQAVCSLIMLYRNYVISYLWTELQHYVEKGHQRFHCGFSEVHGFQEDKCCDVCRPLLRKSTRSFND